MEKVAPKAGGKKKSKEMILKKELRNIPCLAKRLLGARVMGYLLTGYCTAWIL